MKIPSQFPRHLIVGYWREVEDLLVNQYGVSHRRAKIGIRNYRQAVFQAGVGDIQYHADAKDRAQAIFHAGYLPQLAPNARRTAS